MKRTIRLRGLNGSFKGQSWEAVELLRVGRLGPTVLAPSKRVRVLSRE